MIVALLSVVQWSHQLICMHIDLIAGVSWCQAYKWDPVCMFLLQEKNYFKKNQLYAHTLHTDTTLNIVHMNGAMHVAIYRENIAW